MFLSLGKEKEKKIEFVNLSKKIADNVYNMLVESTNNKSASKKLHNKILSNIGESGTVYYVDYKINMNADEAEYFADVVRMMVLYKSTMEKDKECKVILRITSPGGEVSSYGYAASQIKVLKDNGIKVVAIVDKVAASGGYMVASVCDEVYASEYAYIGSIGVVAEFPNFNELLKTYGVNWVERTAGDSKRSLTPFGSVNEDKEKIFDEKLEKIHKSFKDHVSKNRENVDIDAIGNGDVFFGKEALDMNLIDDFGSSDSILMNHMLQNYNILQVVIPDPTKTKKKGIFGSILSKLVNNINIKM